MTTAVPASASPVRSSLCTPLAPAGGPGIVAALVRTTLLGFVREPVSFIMQFLFAFGLAFLLPVLLMLLNRAGILSRDQLVGFRRYFIVAAFVIAAVITPPDVLSQLLLAIPLILLYEIALVVMYFTGRARARAAAAAAAAESAAQVPAATRAPGGA